VKITILVDNHAGKGLLAEHGFSALLDVSGRRILFDTGQSGYVLLENARSLGVDLGGLDAVALSHTHYDHIGGLGALIPFLRDVPIYCGAGVPQRLQSPEYSNCRFCAAASPQQITQEVMTGGHIFRRCEFEARPGMYPGEEESGGTGDEMLDEQPLFVKCQKGILVICGCAHPGVVNIVEDAGEVGGEVFALFGGLHLGGAPMRQIRRTAEELKNRGVRRIYPAHCTGREAGEYFKKVFGEDCHFCEVGAVFNFD